MTRNYLDWYNDDYFNIDKPNENKASYKFPSEISPNNTLSPPNQHTEILKKTINKDIPPNALQPPTGTTKKGQTPNNNFNNRVSVIHINNNQKEDKFNNARIDYDLRNKTELKIDNKLKEMNKDYYLYNFSPIIYLFVGGVIIYKLF